MKVHLGKPNDDMTMCGQYRSRQTLDDPELATCTSCLAYYVANQEWYWQMMGLPRVDYKTLLEKYMRHVDACVSSTFVTNNSRRYSAETKLFTDEEWAALQEIDNARY